MIACVYLGTPWREFSIKDLKMRRSKVKFSGLLESLTKIETGCLRKTKGAILVE